MYIQTRRCPRRFLVLMQAAAASQPREIPYHDPALGQDGEATGLRIFA